MLWQNSLDSDLDHTRATGSSQRQRRCEVEIMVQHDVLVGSRPFHDLTVFCKGITDIPPAILPT
ncbi:MAG: hypothetical protein DWH84_00455 [Planctomycetota bacterium]|nr:MAG: hypothetical protein DWH84_00455 [Planctomycetota bacterium]